MSGISTHVLDLTRGKPAVGVAVRLSRKTEGAWLEVSRRETNAEGRVKSLLGDSEPPAPGEYRLHFETGEYFRRQGVEAFHPFVEITFEVRDEGEHCHIPLLVTPHSYSTYRGS